MSDSERSNLSTSSSSPSEFEIIQQYFQKTTRNQSVSQSIGDDCAVVSVPAESELVLSMDTLVLGRHFPESATPQQIAERAFCTCLSDLAAMGAQPQWFTLGLTLPEANVEWLQDFSDSLLAIAQEYQCDLIGGDTTQGPLVITLQVHGFIKKGQALTRHSAKPGDRVFVTGNLGDGRAALDILTQQREVDVSTKDYLMHRFYRPTPQIQAGLQLVGKANGVIDVSDGLVADLEHIAKASKVSIEIDVETIPISNPCHTVAGDEAINYALTGGDDYQLVFTVSDFHYQTIKALIEDSQLLATEIGRVTCPTESPSVLFKKGEVLTTMSVSKGYQHFAS